MLINEKQEWLQDLIDRTNVEISMTLLQFVYWIGSNNQHPLITSFLPNERLHTYRTPWGSNHSWPGGGHGTGMAGLAIHG